MNSEADKLNWKYRRRYLIAVTAFTMGLMIYAATGVPGAELGEVIITNGYWVLAALTGTYVFGAVWDHTSQRKFGRENTAVTKE